MSQFSHGPAARMGDCRPGLAAVILAQHAYGFDAPTARRLAFVRWLVATGRLREQDPAIPPRADAGAAPPAPTRAA